jgi:hypothetical protein
MKIKHKIGFQVFEGITYFEAKGHKPQQIIHIRMNNDE